MRLRKEGGVIGVQPRKLSEGVLRKQSRVGHSGYFHLCGHGEGKHLHPGEENSGKNNPLCYVRMVLRPRLKLPSLHSWLGERDAESITSASANQSAESHNRLRRTAAAQLITG